MFDKTKNPINHDWNEYYEMLESIRISGITNMWGATPYLAQLANIDEKLASQVLCSWITNYDELAEFFDWRTVYYIDTDIVTEEAFRIYLAHCIVDENINEARASGCLDDIEDIGLRFERAQVEADGIFDQLRATEQPEIIAMHTFKIVHN